MSTTTNDYSGEFSGNRFWKLVRGAAGRVAFLRDAVAMFYCLKDQKTPKWVKGLIVAALGYFVCPVDAVPDALPVIGWLDDAGVISGTLAAINEYVTPEHRRAAKRALS